MNILTTNRKSGPYETINDYLKKSLTSSEYELELVYGSHPKNKLTKTEFIRLLNYVRQKYKFYKEINDLDITMQTTVSMSRDRNYNSLSDIRCTITGVMNIQKYCKTNSIDDIPTVSFMKKLSTKDPKNPSLSFNQIKNTDYNFRINLKKEIDMNDTDEEIIKFKDELKDSLKFYRYKKRFSFLSDDNLYRIDLTIVKNNNYNNKRKNYDLYKNLIDSKILKNKEFYELEIEYIGFNKINSNYPIDLFSKKIYSEIDNESKLTQEEYEKQVALTSYKVDSNISFSPDNTYLPSIDDSGYEFLTEYGGINNDDDDDYLQPYEEDKDKITMSNSLWSKCASLKGNPMDIINLNYWWDRGQWLFFTIIKNNKQVLFDGVYENYTDTYENAPKNDNYIKYIIYPKITEDDIVNLPETYHEEFLKEIKSDTFNSNFNVPISLIEEFEFRKIDNDKAGAPPSWGPPEYYKLNKDKRFVDIVILKLNEIIISLLVNINNSNLIVSQRKCNEILEQYKTLTEQVDKYCKFIGPNPVSMDLQCLDVNNPHCILRGYSVTEKADGIRCQLFVNKDGLGWLISQKLNIIFTGLRFKGLYNTILDGEYITKDRDNNDIKLFMIFDVYYNESGNHPFPPHTMPWIGKRKSDISRSKILHDIKLNLDYVFHDILSLNEGIFINNWEKDSTKIKNEDTIRIGFKQFYDGPKQLKKDKKNPDKFSNINSIGKLSKKILDLDKKNSFEYSIDGLIFLPSFYSVGSNNEAIVNDSITGTWYQNYKWKPPEENTIDFRLRFVKETINDKKVNKITSFKKDKKIIKCQQVHLYVGYDIKKDTTTDFAWKVITGYKKNLTETFYNPPFEDDSIHICNIPLTKNKLTCLKDKSEVEDGFIYEMRYEPNNPFGYQWIPLRIRDDKKRPNDTSTANNVWKTIKYPVTEKLITAKDDITKIDYKEDISDKSGYWIDDEPDSDADISLRTFHNYIKDKLINSVISSFSKKVSILDTSVGRGGDINKYLRQEDKLNFFLGLDISSDINFAAKRYYLKNSAPKAMFIQYDTGKSISNGEGCIGDNIERDKSLIDILYSRQKKLPEELRKIVPRFKGLAKNKFNIISSQFTLHYYFKDELTLRNYIQNISENLVTGGYFIGTCYDGMKVFNLFNELKSDIFEMIDDFGNKVFSITKNYDIEDFTYQKDNTSKLIGNEIKVYMNSIGQEITEYLVNFEYLINLMKQYDLILHKPSINKDYKGIFDNDSLSYTDGFGGFELIVNELDKLYSKDLSLKQFFPESFELLKDNNLKLKQLSSLNNWFIFQKQ
jgi:hypothetical protein